MPRNGKRVVVTGCGAITPIGKNSRETFENAKNGVSGIEFLRSFETQGLPCRIGGQVDDSWLNALPAKGLQGIEKCSSRGLKLMISAVSEAVESARLDLVRKQG